MMTNDDAPMIVVSTGAARPGYLREMIRDLYALSEKLGQNGRPLTSATCSAAAREIERHEARVTELLHAINAEVQRRRDAEAALAQVRAELELVKAASDDPRTRHGYIACQRCGRGCGMDAVIPDDLWREISPSGDGAGMLCLWCIDERLRERGYEGVPVRLYFSGAGCESMRPEGPFQARVQPWMMACFGPEIAADRSERSHRFLEESLELVQACGCTADEAHQLVDYVYGRPVGEPDQEVGGVMVTLAALCLAAGLDMHQAGERELTRIWGAVEKIRAKQAAKPKHSPLPGGGAFFAENAKMSEDEA